MILENEIKQLERSVNTLVHRPTLIRRDYWTTETEKLLLCPGLSIKDRHRLSALLNLLNGILKSTAPERPPLRHARADQIDCDACDLP
ncbi:MAG TPA: hypothetical protein VNO24_09775 [Blastocatellia bacterium]|nr:hypothetical protein [Blastocatellia bacterium]